MCQHSVRVRLVSAVTTSVRPVLRTSIVLPVCVGRELLSNNFSNLPASDIFALGCSMYELLSATPMSGSGNLPEFHRGVVAPIAGVPEDVMALVRVSAVQGARGGGVMDETIPHTWRDSALSSCQAAT